MNKYFHEINLTISKLLNFNLKKMNFSKKSNNLNKIRKNKVGEYSRHSLLS